jgi:hypothetical protein
MVWKLTIGYLKWLEFLTTLVKVAAMLPIREFVF